MKIDLERNETSTTASAKTKSTVEPSTSCKQRIEKLSCWRNASNSVSMATDVLQGTDIEFADSRSQ